MGFMANEGAVGSVVSFCLHSSYPEVMVLVIFVILVLLWVFRELNFIPGWAAVFPTYENGRRSPQELVEVH